MPTEDLEDLYPAITVLSRPVAELGIYPAVDPLDSTSSVMDPNVIGYENYDIIRDVQDNIAILVVNELSEEDKIKVARARKSDRFLSQAFQAPEVFAGNHGELVLSSETSSGFREIVAGKFDHQPEVAFYKVGYVAKYDIIEQEVEVMKSTSKFKMKTKAEKVFCISVDHVVMAEDELVKNVDFAVEFLGSLLKSLADAVTEKVAGRNQVRDQGGGDQDYAGYTLGIGLAKFDDAPDDSGLAIS